MNKSFKLASAVLAVACTLVFTSCKKDTAPVPGNPVATKLKEYKNGDEFIRFMYNADGSLQKATVKNELNTGNAVVDYSVSYNAQKKIAEITNTSGEKIVPVYNNNVLVRADLFDGPVKMGYTAYHYEAGLLKRATIYFLQGADFEPALEFILTYDGSNNVTETVAMMANGTPGQLRRAGHVTSQYDRQTNPLFEHRDFLALLWQGVSVNNPVREDHFAANSTLEDRYDYVYTFNAANLPQKATVTKGLPGQPGTVTAISFLYQ